MEFDFCPAFEKSIALVSDTMLHEYHCRAIADLEKARASHAPVMFGGPNPFIEAPRALELRYRQEFERRQGVRRAALLEVAA